MKALFSSILLAILCLPAAAFGEEARLEAIGGSDTVQVNRADKKLQLKKGEALTPGDEVVTGRNTAVDIRLSDRSLIRVGANSSYKLEMDSTAKRFFHRLLTGIVRVMVPPSQEGKAGKVRFRMNTPEGTIGVRGTEFVVIRDKEETTLKGLEGEVMFGPAEADFDQESEFVYVVKGTQSVVRKGGKPSQPGKFDEAGYLKEIESKKGSFGALSFRGSENRRSRSTIVAKAEPPARSAKSELKARKKPAPALKKAPEKIKMEGDPDRLLLIASGNGDLEKVVELVEKKEADVNFQDEKGTSPLHAAARGSHEDVVKYLISKKANVNMQDLDGETPLMQVVWNADSVASARIVDSLVLANADAKMKNLKELSALDMAHYLQDEAKKAEDKALFENILVFLGESPKGGE